MDANAPHGGPSSSEMEVTIPSLAIAAVTFIAVILVMLGEAALSAHNETVLRARGAIESEDRIFDALRWAYPGCFMAMAAEGALTGPSTPTLLPIGLAIFGLSKALKIWTISTLGVRWTFRVLVLPGTSPVTNGPYRLMRHPNYLAILGEFAGVALTVWAPVTGLVSIVGYGALLRRKIAVEDRALGRQ